ncbi:hypothetical protein [Citrobacter freundii]|uniref:hypothetical protein n=1 Tax=Citrobacter freundii TaxID=546 RepID=UPI002934A4F2|nr:hypothetical protein [Citrobacter freundii]
MKITRLRLIVGHLRQIFLYINKKVGGSGGSVVQYPSRPRQLWVLLNHLLNLSGGSVALLGGSLPASENNPFLSGGSKYQFGGSVVVHFLTKKHYKSITITY